MAITTKDLALPRGPCSRCHGAKKDPDNKDQDCWLCKGSGKALD